MIGVIHCLLRDIHEKCQSADTAKFMNYKNKDSFSKLNLLDSCLDD